MKILFIFTGGTIGSTLEDGVMYADRSKPYKIIKAYEKKYAIDFEYEVCEPYTDLSENNTGEHLKELIRCVKEHISGDYDGIVVTHGTDTLAYSAAAIGYAIGLSSIPVCIVSAARPIEHERTNAIDNIRGAIRFINSKGGRGAFAVYRNESSNTVLVHRATRILGPVAYSDELRSIDFCPYGHFDGDKFIKNQEYSEKEDETDTLSAEKIDEESNSILVLSSYVGMKYPTPDERVKYIIMNTYHSGTLNTSSEAALKFFTEAKKAGIKVYATGIYDGDFYESATVYSELGITPIKNIAPIAAYVKLWLMSESGRDVESEISQALGGDV